MNVLKQTQTLIVGIGNPYRGDDAVGLRIARKLRSPALDTVKILEQSGEATALMDCWDGATRVVLIDAVASGAPPGTIHCWDASAQPLPSRAFACSTHNFGVFEAIELARTLHRLPRHLIVYGVEGVNFKLGEELSQEVAKAVDAAVELILRQIGEFSKTAALEPPIKSPLPPLPKGGGGI